jgi:hypothetical protein
VADVTRSGSETVERARSDKPRSGGPRRSRRSRLGLGRREALLLGGALVLLVAVVAGAWVVLRGGGGDPAPSRDASAAGGSTTTMETGGIEVDAPEGWRAVPLPQLGFGVAIPSHWEAVVLSDDALSDLSGASPVVPGFLEAAHAAQQTGAVFYAAGVDDQGRITDLTVRAEPGTGITDTAGLEAYARQLATAGGVTNPAAQAVEGAENPAVDVRYQVRTERPAEEAGAAPRAVTVQGTQRAALGTSPRNVVYTLIVTSDDAPDHDAVAGDLLGSLAFAPTPPG